MPQPVGKDLHVDGLLTNISVAYRNNNYIADGIFPLVTVNRQSDIIPAYDQSPWYRDTAKLRAPGTKSQGGGFTVDTTAKYFCDRYSYRYEINDEDRDNTDAPFNLDRDAVDFVTDKIQMRREVAFAGDFFKASVWKTDKTGGTDFTKWDDYANSTPLVDVTAYKDVIEGTIGIEPNQFIMGKGVWNDVRYHPDLVDLIKYTQRGMITQDLFAAMIEFPSIKIGRTIYTTTEEGTAEASVVYTRVWGKSVLMLYTPERPSLLTPAAGYTFVWNRVPGAAQYIKRFRDDEREVDIVEVNSYFDQKAVATKAGLFMGTVVD